MNAVETALLYMVRADSSSRLKRAMKKQHIYRTTAALKELVGSSLPDIHMPSSTIDTVYRKTAGPHVAWKWVSARGMLTLLVEVPLPNWDRIVVTAFVTYPGITKTPRQLYRNETNVAAAVPELVHQAVRQFERL